MIEQELQSAAQLVNPRTEVLRGALTKIVRSFDTTGISLSVLDSITDFEAHVEALEKASIAVMSSEVDAAMLDSVHILKDIITNSGETTQDKISAIKALGVVGGYVAKRRDMLKPSRGGGNQINVVIDNSIDASSPAKNRYIEEFDE